jgi:hypothetical protein
MFETLRRVFNNLADLLKASEDIRGIKTPEDFMVYSGLAERISEDEYQLFLFKMRDTPVDRSIGRLDSYLRKV